MSEALKQSLMIVVVVIGGMKSPITQTPSSSPGVTPTNSPLHNLWIVDKFEQKMSK